jgi:hypothetical protein
MPARTARQCRDRYKNYLVEDLVCEAWSPQEDAVIVDKFREIGPKWVEISKFLNGRSGNHVKNRWHKHLSKGQRQQQPPTNPIPQPQAQPRVLPRLEAQSAPVFVEQHPVGGPPAERKRDAQPSTSANPFQRFSFVPHLF